MIVDRLRMHAVHALAHAALRFSSPPRAVQLASAFARFFRPLAGPDAARDAIHVLRGHGTCLSRSIAVAARLPAACVAIGVDPSVPSALAHAWVEVEGGALLEGDRRGGVIASLSMLPSCKVGGGEK